MTGCQKDEKKTDQKSPTPPRHFKTQVPWGWGKGVDLAAPLDIYSSFHPVVWMTCFLGRIRGLNSLFPVPFFGKTILSYAILI